VSIGATLAAARRRAGMSVSDLSQSTRVREPIIRAVEHDDYAACGGDFYARGHIRAIARAVGEDPAPLIDEFDSTWRSTGRTVQLRPGVPVHVRYVLIWFTKLPPDNAGTYQASVYKITVEGRAR